ncbi:MAG: hypothetical protein M3461_11300 [Pseudomonadota bacterium]|nr:hypothetical protein [Pseudomonadota bacterium]
MSTSRIPATKASWAQLARGEVDGYPGAREALPAPGRGLLARAREDPSSDGYDEPGLLGDGDELRGGDEPALRVPPAQQRLDTGDRQGPEIEQRLIVQRQLATLQTTRRPFSIARR